MQNIGLYCACPCSFGCGVERKNSSNKRESRTPKDSGFFATRFLIPSNSTELSFGREGDGYNTRKGKKSARLVTGS